MKISRGRKLPSHWSMKYKPRSCTQPSKVAWCDLVGIVEHAIFGSKNLQRGFLDRNPAPASRCAGNGVKWSAVKVRRCRRCIARSESRPPRRSPAAFYCSRRRPSACRMPRMPRTTVPYCARFSLASFSAGSSVRSIPICWSTVGISSPRAGDVRHLESSRDFHIHSADALQGGLVSSKRWPDLRGLTRGVAFAVGLPIGCEHSANLGIVLPSDCPEPL